MTREEYKNSIKELEERKKEIEKEYISSNIDFKIGDKVRITSDTKTLIGYITGYEIDRYGIIPIVRKAKRDGSKALVGDIYIYDNKQIEKII